MIDQVVKNFSDRSSEMLQQLGIPAPLKPTRDVVFPEDLGSIPDQNLSEHLTYWASMCSYITHKVSILEGSLVLARKELDQEYDLRWIAAVRAGGPTSDRKHRVMSMKTMISLRDRVATIDSDLKVLKSILSGYEIKNSAISREITRRQTERQLRNG